MSLHIGQAFRDEAAENSSVKAELELCRLALASTSECILVHRVDGTLLLFNEALAASLGYTPEEFAELPPFGWSPLASDDQRRKRLERIKQPGGHTFQSEVTLPTGEIAVAEVHSRYADTPFGELVVSVSHDVTRRVRAERMLHDLAFHDALTGVANRAAFDERLEAAITSATRHGDLLGVCYVDIDGFKMINDRCGHGVGDSVLIAIARRLEGAVRSEDMVARLGGDEFVIILPRLDAADDLKRVAAKLAETVSRRLKVSSKREFDLTAAIGCALFDPATDDARSLVARADIAMYRSKSESPRVP